MVTESGAPSSGAAGPSAGSTEGGGGRVAPSPAPSPEASGSAELRKDVAQADRTADPRREGGAATVSASSPEPDPETPAPVSSAFVAALRFELSEPDAPAGAPATAPEEGEAESFEKPAQQQPPPPVQRAAPAARAGAVRSGASGSAFSDLEMAFFEQDLQKVEEVDTFEDLVQDLPEPETPWGRFFGRSKPAGKKKPSKPTRRPRPPGKRK